MYSKNLTEDLRLRLSETDMDFLRGLSETRGTTISEVIRSIIGEYRRSVDMLETMKEAVKLIQEKKGAELSYGDTETDIINQL